MFEINLESIPDNPGVYTFLDEKGKILYVGKALNLKKRVASYFNSSEKSPKTIKMVESAKDIKFIVTMNEKEALLLENNIIKNEKPKFNIRLKDAKSYPFIKITDDDFPKLSITRDIHEKDGIYFGPFVDVGNLRTIVSEVLKIFPIRTCSDNRFNKHKICLNYQIKKCSGPCENLILKDDYRNLVENLKKFFTGKIGEVKDFLKKKMESYSNRLMFEDAAKVRDSIFAIDKLFAKQGTVITEEESMDIFIFDRDSHFYSLCIMFIRYGKLVGVQVEFLDETEEIDKTLYILQYYSMTRQPPSKICIIENKVIQKESEILKDALEEIFSKKITFSRTINKNILDIGYENILSQKEMFLKKDDNINKATISLQEILGIDRLETIECIDISHLYGKNTVGASICWEINRFNKKRYRKYRIKNEANDDFFAIYELMKRKGEDILANKEEKADLYLIDGGLGQLNAAIKGFNEVGIEAKIISISKGRSIKKSKFKNETSIESIHIPNRKNSINLPKNNHALLLLQKIRDEAHRFVITYMRKSYEKKLISSGILDIKGVGKSRLKKILTEYPDILKKTDISPEEISRKCSIPHKIANDIVEYIKKLNFAERSETV